MTLAIVLLSFFSLIGAMCFESDTIGEFWINFAGAFFAQTIAFIAIAIWSFNRIEE